MIRTFSDEAIKQSYFRQRSTPTVNHSLLPDVDEKLAPVHPGIVLLEEYLLPMGISQNQLALSIRVPARRINEIVHGKRRITADTALRLARFFQVTPQFWLGLQMDYDLDVAEDELGERLDKEVLILNETRRDYTAKPQ
jgi:addiction module HigA family antidote